MSVLIDERTRAVVQGITGSEGHFHTRRMLDDGTKIVAGVTPGKGGERVEGVPVFDTVAGAVDETKANASILFVPQAFAADAIIEAAEAGIELIVCLTEGIPIHDMLVARRYIDIVGARLIGPNTPGLISPGKSKLGVMAGHIHRPG
ncbi:MAG: succinate--CoA ligase subunit alpha, partial [Candidatus Bipolaricaulia bacterium]